MRETILKILEKDFHYDLSSDFCTYEIQTIINDTIQASILAFEPLVIKKAKKDIDISFVDAEYLECFEMWLSYKKSKGQTYKSKVSIDLCYKKLIAMCNNSPILACEIVNQSIANNYAGLFPLRDGMKSQGTNKESKFEYLTKLGNDYGNE